MVASTLLAVMSQRLLRLTCKYCAEPSQPSLANWNGPRNTSARNRERHLQEGPRLLALQRHRVFRTHRRPRAPRDDGPLASAIHGGDPARFEREAREHMGKDTLGRRALGLVMAGDTTLSEAMKVISSTET
jgi:MSHA biogenesis protein MshE